MLVQKTNLVGCFKRLSIYGNSELAVAEAKQTVAGWCMADKLWLHLACTRNRGPIPSRSMVLADLHKAPKNESAFHPLSKQSAG